MTNGNSSNCPEPTAGNERPCPGQGDFWVFAYGSLMWNPGFPYLHSTHARLNGYHRAPCIYSWVYRGSERDPGLVMGLDEGGSCEGIAFRVAAALREKVIAYLDARELVTAVYLPRWLPVSLAGEETVEALCYLADRDHAQYAGSLPAAEAARIIRRARGQAGANIDYIVNTWRHLQEMKIPDEGLEAIIRHLGQERGEAFSREQGRTD